MEAMTLPSRQFLVQQAVLSAAKRQSIIGDAHSYLRAVRDMGFCVSGLFQNRVIEEYRALVSRYGREG